VVDPLAGSLVHSTIIRRFVKGFQRCIETAEVEIGHTEQQQHVAIFGITQATQLERSTQGITRFFPTLEIDQNKSTLQIDLAIARLRTGLS
jgi:hypothetical protein